MKEFNEKFVCPECGAEMVSFNGDMTICKECGHVAFGENIKQRLEDGIPVIWECKQCGAVLNEQEGFDPEQEEWRCTECGCLRELYGSEDYDEYDLADVIEYILETILPYIDACFENYEYDEEREKVTIYYDTDSDIGIIPVDVYLDFEMFQMETKLPLKAEGWNMSIAGEYLHRLNGINRYGSFVLDYDTGEIIHRYAIDFQEGQDGIIDALEIGLGRISEPVATFIDGIEMALSGRFEPKVIIEDQIEKLIEELQKRLEEVEDLPF